MSRANPSNIRAAREALEFASLSALTRPRRVSPTRASARARRGVAKNTSGTRHCLLALVRARDVVYVSAREQLGAVPYPSFLATLIARGPRIFPYDRGSYRSDGRAEINSPASVPHLLARQRLFRTRSIAPSWFAITLRVIDERCRVVARGIAYRCAASISAGGDGARAAAAAADL